MNYHEGFKLDKWQDSIDVANFIQVNLKEYLGDGSFLEGPTVATIELWDKLKPKFAIEREKGIYSAETKLPTGITVYGAGYIDERLEKIVGLQTDAPLKRAIFPNGGLRMVESSLEAFGYELDPITKDFFVRNRKTHNDGVFSVYTDEIKKARKTGLITGLPDAYGRGRIIGDYRRVALYGVDRLIEEKTKDFNNRILDEVSEDLIRDREELFEQIKALKELKELGKIYGFDISRPASDVKEAIQWLYFGYLAATKQQNGAAMSLGRISEFIDIYAERDLESGKYTEKEIQEFIDHFVMKLRIIRFLRTPEYDALFSGDPIWATISINESTKTGFRIINTLYNMGPSPEPNLTILWNENSPINWKKFCAKASIDTSSLQYENDNMMSKQFGKDYAIACCVSPMEVGKQMQFFGARVNLPKALLYAINGGKDEKQKIQVTPSGMFESIKGEYLEFDEVWEKYDKVLDWLAKTYVQSLNMIHYMHDKYSYESLQFALHDSDIRRTQAFGIAGLSIVADSLAAIKYGKVRIIRDEDGDAVDYVNEGDEYVPFGNNDDKTDEFAVRITKLFMDKIRTHKMYRNAIPTQSVLTITSNVVV